MRRIARLFALFAVTLAAFGAEPGFAQIDDRKAARCAQLGALLDRYTARRSEGSGGSNLARHGAGLDCDRGRYDQGIRALEDLLRRNAIAVPG